MRAFVRARVLLRVYFGLLLALVVGLQEFGEAAFAQTYPSRPIKFILHVPPGGSIDAMARMLGENLSEKWGQPVVIENRPGASGTIGMGAVARAAPDGYTYLFGTGATLVINRIVFPEIATLLPVSRLATNPILLVVNAKQVPATTLQEFVNYAKANPGRLNYGSSGNNGITHLTAEMFQLRAGVTLTKVTYKGVAPAMLDLLSGQVQLMMVDISTALPHIESGSLRVLATAGNGRHPLLPNIPAFNELYPDFIAETWFAIAAPPKTPPEIIAKLSGAAGEAIRTAQFQKALEKMGNIEAIGSTPAEMAAFLKEEEKRWEGVLRVIGRSSN